ncbi:MAG: helix-turn-helix transcriptional regulator [Bacilli bacterium]|nr:helix-turn-helix transcriptional regulator [Bacilli bacterium]
MDQQKIGKFIQEQRKKQKLTQEQLAEKLGITKGAVSKWERGLSLMDMSLLKPLSEILEVSIIEIINGEEIKDKEIKQKSSEAIVKTIKHSKDKEKKIKRRTITKTLLTVFLIFVIGFLTYKVSYIKIYSNQDREKEEIKKIVDGLSNQQTMTIYKKTLNENEYLIYDDIKIRNDFKNFKYEEKLSSKKWQEYKLYDENGKTKSVFMLGSATTYIDYFTSEAILVGDLGQFNSADRNYFLLRNDINDDIDFLNYIKDNYFAKSNIFTQTRKIKENYALNLFVDVAIPRVDSLTIINGDYTGFIFNLNNVREVNILRNNKRYIFMFTGSKYITDEYIKDILSTVEIK